MTPAWEHNEGIRDEFRHLGLASNANVPAEAPSGPPDATRDGIRPDVLPHTFCTAHAVYVSQLQRRIHELENALDRQANVISALADAVHISRPATPWPFER